MSLLHPKTHKSHVSVEYNDQQPVLFFFKPLENCTVKFTISSTSDVTVFYISGHYA